MTVTEFLLAHLWQLIGLAGLVACSGFFSGAETALFSLSRAQLLRFDKGDRRVGHTIAALMRRPRRLLMVLLLGNQLVNVAFFAIAATLELAVAASFELAWWIEAALLASPLLGLILLGEVGPKSLAVASPVRFSKIIAVPLAALVRLLGPVQAGLSVWLIEPLTRLFSPSRPAPESLAPEELAALLEISSNRGLISSDQSTWLREVIELSRVRVSDIMVPRVDMVAHDIDNPPTKLAELFRTSGLVKIPVYRGDLDSTEGLIYAKDVLLKPEAKPESLLRPVHYVPEAGTVEKLLQQFRQTRTQIAIAVDEYGGTAGLVTLEDALEEIVGEIAGPDEDIPDPVQQIGEREYLIDGDLPVHEWPDQFGMALPAERISTIGGLVISLLGRVPSVGDEATYRNLAFTVETVRGRRIGQLRLRLREKAQ